jgi:hypothetical protein
MWMLPKFNWNYQIARVSRWSLAPALTVLMLMFCRQEISVERELQ